MHDKDKENYSGSPEFGHQLPRPHRHIIAVVIIVKGEGRVHTAQQGQVNACSVPGLWAQVSTITVHMDVVVEKILFTLVLVLVTPLMTPILVQIFLLCGVYLVTSMIALPDILQLKSVCHHSAVASACQAVSAIWCEIWSNFLLLLFLIQWWGNRLSIFNI